MYSFCSLWKTFGIVAAVVIALIGCSSSVSVARSLPCHEGWKVNQHGASTLYTPTEDEIIQSKAQLPHDRVIGCYHSVPPDLILVANKNKKTSYATYFRYENGALQLVEEEIIITARH
jgi:hypothetical protein